MQWGAQNAAEFADDARIVIIDANKQSDFAARLQVTESSVVIIKRYSNAMLQIRRIYRLGIDFSLIFFQKLLHTGSKLAAAVFRRYLKI